MPNLKNLRTFENYINESNDSEFKHIRLEDNQHRIYSLVDTSTNKGFRFFIKPMKDTTHFYMSNDLSALQAEYPSGAAVWHIGQHRNEPYYTDLVSMLKQEYRKNNR